MMERAPVQAVPGTQAAPRLHSTDVIDGVVHARRPMEVSEMNTTLATRVSAGLLFAAGLGVLATGCDRKEEHRALGTERRSESPQAEKMGSVNGAVDSIAAARCDREARCNNVGPDKNFDSRDQCLAKVKSDKRDDLNAKDCPGGIDQGELRECLEETRNSDCNNPFDELGRIAACRSSDLCRHMP
jgi:hypothetical protein